MKNLTNPPLRQLFVLLAVLSPVGNSFAVIDKFDPYAYVRVVNDSNILRVSGDQEARALLASTSRNDTIGYFGAGFESDLKLSRQHLLFDGEIERADYDSFDELDHTRTKGRTEKIGYLNGGYQIHPDWWMSAGMEYSDVSYQERQRLDRDSTAGTFAVVYRNTLNTPVGMRVKYTDYDLRDDSINGISTSNDYTEAEISGLFYWEVTGKSKLEANLGYTDQSYDDLDERDFQGATGRLTYDWNVTGKTELEFSAWRVKRLHLEEKCGKTAWGTYRRSRLKLTGQASRVL